jgi:hypothetical protein
MNPGEAEGVVGREGNGSQRDQEGTQHPIGASETLDAQSSERECWANDNITEPSGECSGETMTPGDDSDSGQGTSQHALEVSGTPASPSSRHEHPIGNPPCSAVANYRGMLGKEDDDLRGI